MKKLKINLTLLFICLLVVNANSVFSQATQLNLSADVVRSQKLNNDYEGLPYDGTPYAFEGFKEATIGDNEKVYKVRYNIFNDQLEVEIKPNSIIALSYVKTPYKVVILNEPLTYAYFPDLVNGKYYAEVLWEKDDKMLLKTYDKRFEEGKEADGYRKAEDPSFSSSKEEYFYRFADGRIEELPNNPKKRAALIFNDKKIEKSIKSSDLNLRKENDLVKALDQYMM